MAGKQDVSHAGHDDSRASEAAAPLVRQIEDMLANTSAGTKYLPPPRQTVLMLLYLLTLHFDCTLGIA